MRTREVISKCNKYEDTFGNDLAGKGHLKSKLECLRALEDHKGWLESAVHEEMRSIDRFIHELGIEWEDC